MKDSTIKIDLRLRTWIVEQLVTLPQDARFVDIDNNIILIVW